MSQPRPRRKGARASTAPRALVGLYVGPLTPAKPIGPVRNRRAVRLTATQRNSQGRYSEWSRSPYAPKGGWR